MANDDPKRTRATGTVVDSDRSPLPGLVPVTPETQVQDDRHHQPLFVSPAAIERYSLKDEIGRGGMGTVYYARDGVLHRDVAVKVLQERYGSGGAAAARFIDEAKISGQLQHPGIPPVHDLGTLPDGRPFMAMKLIRGRTLAARLAEIPRPDSTRLLVWFAKICETVAYAHDKHVIHRDLKPGNVMVGAHGEVQVMDWGLAKVLGEAAGIPKSSADDDPASDPIQSGRDPDTHTQAGSTMGTPAYMPPEQARGEIEMVDARADVLCLGGILCEMLTGKPPYTGKATDVRAKAALGHLVEAYARLDRCGADPEVVALAKRCLSIEPTDRPADAGAVASAVVAYQDGLEARLRRAEVDSATAQTQAAESRKRARLRAILLALGLGFVLVFTVYNFMLVEANDDARRANNDASKANAEAKKANDDAMANNQLTEEAIDQFVAGLREDDRLKKYDDLRDVRRKLLETAVDFNKKLLARGGDEARLRYKRADVHQTLGLLYAELEDLKQSEAEYRTATDLFAALSAANPTDDEALAGLASATNRLGNTLERLGQTAGARNRVDPATVVGLYREAIRLRRILVDRTPADDHKIDLATSLSNLAGVYSNPETSAAEKSTAVVVFREAEAILKPLVDGPTSSLRAERQFARLQTNLALNLFFREDPEFPAALTVGKKAFEQIVRRYPDRDELRYEYVTYADKVGHVWYERGKIEDAATWLGLAAQECGAIVDAHPGVLKYRMDYADILLNRAVTAFEAGTPGENVVPLMTAALDQVRRLYRDHPGQRGIRPLGLDACDKLAAVLTLLNRHAEAMAVWDEARSYAPARRLRAIELRREFARARAGDVATAVKNARAIEGPPESAEECGYLAAVLATAATTAPPAEAEQLRAEVRTALATAELLPDYERFFPELLELPALKPFLN